MTTLAPLFNLHRILPQLEAGELILTPNNRLRSKILQAWGDYQQTQDHRIWRAPRVEVIDQWFLQQWANLQAQLYSHSLKVIASPDQQRVLWEQITANCGLMQTTAVAKQAASALRTLALWGFSADDLKHHYKDSNSSQLASWALTFQKQLDQMGLITPEESYTIIGSAFDAHKLSPENNIYLLGFDDIAPLIERQLQKASQNIVHLPPSNHSAHSLIRTEFESTDEEMNAAAQWARHILEQSNTHPVRIGIIVPNLGQCRKKIELAFTAEFEAHSFSPDTERYTLPFNFSAGTPLGDTPLITSTLQLLALQQQEWDVEFIVQILLSPFWGHYSQEIESRCALADKLQSLGIFSITGDQLRYWAQRIDELNSYTAPLFDYLNTFNQLLSSPSYKGKHLPSQWVDIFLQQLEILYWPGERTPDSQEYQQTQLWYQLLEKFSMLDTVLGAISHFDALQQLQQMANHTPFQAKVPDSPIQILGILEGAGLDFTHCWIMGLHQQAWPPTAKPNALLPIRMQREHNMPHASSLRELHYAQSLTENYRHCADTIIFSSANHEDDSEQLLLASQLISDIPLETIVTEAAIDSLSQWQDNLHLSQIIELVDCQKAPAFISQKLPGGASLLKNQSENPFDSFARYRLKAQEPLKAMNGFSHIEKGNILHHSLAAIWTELKTQYALIELSQDALNLLIDKHVSESIQEIKKHKYKHLSDTLCQLERQRQSELIALWLEQEKKRPPFTVVAIEEKQEIHFAQCTLTIRIDRVDQLQDGSYLIIDYKTGQANINAWQDDRPKDPQLPLYALTFAEDNSDNVVKGISFAQININDQLFKGLGASDIATGIINIEKNRTRLPKTWAEALDHWQQTLTHLLDEFKNGDCAIQYRDPTALSYAENYCRINRFHEADSIRKLMQQINTEVSV